MKRKQRERFIIHRFIHRIMNEIIHLLFIEEKITMLTPTGATDGEKTTGKIHYNVQTQTQIH